jgi:plasmid stabilization system protein ParE
MVIEWSLNAERQFQEAIGYIALDSPQNADRVKLDVIARIKEIALHPERYPLDKYKRANNGTVRAFAVHHYRISYQVYPNAILIVRLRHSRRSPLRY